MLAVLTCALAAQAGSTLRREPAPPPQALTGWAYRWDAPLPAPPGEPLRWRDTATDFWRPTRPGLHLEGQEAHDAAWFRVPLPNTTWPESSVFFTGVDSDFVAYVDGQEIFRSEPPKPGRPPGWPWYLFRLPPGFEGHTLYLHVHSSNPVTIGPFRDTTVGSRSDLLLQTLTRDLPVTLIGLLTIAIGVIALFVWLYQRELRVYLWFGLFAIGEGLVFVAVSECAQLVWRSPTAWASLLWAGRALYPPMLLCFFAEVLAPISPPRVVRLAQGVAAAGLALVAIGCAHYPSVRHALFWFLEFEFLGSVGGVIALSWRFVRRTRRGGRLFGLALLLFVGIAGSSLMNSLGFARLPELMPYGFLLLILGMGSALLRRFAWVHDALAQHARALEAKNHRLEEVEANLKEAVRGRDAFLSIASHELRTPLAVIVNHVYLLQREKSLSPNPRESVDAVGRQARHLTRMVEDLLDVSRIAQGKLHLKPEPLSLGGAVSEAVEAARPAAAAHGVRLVWTAPPERVWVEADPTRVDQMIGNLVRNALKHTPTGGTVTVLLSQEGGRALIRVRDDGEGISPALLPRVFELFVQGDAERTPSEDGLGVGLALVRRLAELHGGSVEASSDGPGKGSELRVWLPLGMAPPAPRPEPVPSPSPQPLRVLLVEDNKNVRLSLKLALQLQGFEILEAEDGEAGLRRIREERPDVALVDIAMPGMNGFTLAREVRSGDAGRLVRLIALTGHGQPHDHAEAEASGFDRLLVKPTDPDELGRLMRELCAAPAAREVALSPAGFDCARPDSR